MISVTYLFEMVVSLNTAQEIIFFKKKNVRRNIYSLSDIDKYHLCNGLPA